MSEKTKTAKPEDLANAELAKSLGATINESALHDWFTTSANLMIAGTLSARGWNATVEASSVSVGFRSTYGAYVLRAFDLQRLAGGRDTSVKVLFTTVQDAVRHESYKDANWAKRVKEAKSFADFRAKIPARKPSGGSAEPKTANDLMKAYIKGIGDLKDIRPTDPELWTKFLAVIDNQRKAIVHPSKGNLKKAS